MLTPESNTPPFGVSLVLACVWHPQTVNVSCDPGKAPSSTGGTCVSCGVGTYSSTGTACEACPAGSVSDTVGRTVRAACVCCTVFDVCAAPSSMPYPPLASGEACTLSTFLFVVLPSRSSGMYVCMRGCSGRASVEAYTCPASA